MKLPSKKITISAVAALTVVICGVSTYAMIAPKAPQKEQASVVKTETELKPVGTQTQPVPEETMEQATPAAASTPVPVPQETTPLPVAVRSFEEIILDYPNMSTGLPGFMECAGYLKNAWPEKFTDANREENIRWVSTTFVNVCGAIDGGPTRDRQYTLQRYWGR